MFTDKTILITGASAGIGAEFARQFHRLGAKLVLVARRREVLERLAGELNSKRSESAEVLAADLTLEHGDKSTCLLGLREVAEFIAGRTIDVLINNAGFGSFGYFDELDLEHEISMIKLNVIAPVVLSHSVIPQMRRRKSGAIIGVSSIAGFQALPYMATYSATKAFDLNHTVSLRYELAADNIRVLSVCPGPTATEFQGVARIPGQVTGIRRDKVEEVVAQSIRALRLNSAMVVPCVRSKLMALPCRILPRSFSTYLAGLSLKGSLPGKRDKP